MSRPDRCSGPAAGILNALIICAATYGLLVGVALAGGRTWLLDQGLLLLMGLLHACLTGLARTAATPTMSIRKPTFTPVGTRAAKN